MTFCHVFIMVLTDNLSMKIEIEVTPEEEKLIKTLAKNCGFSVSRFVLAAVHYFKNTNRI